MYRDMYRVSLDKTSLFYSFKIIFLIISFVLFYSNNVQNPENKFNLLA